MITEFKQLNVKGEILEALIDMGFSTPTPIQAEVIPHMLEGKDCLAKAPTGSGKTCAFAIPALDKIDFEDDNVQTLIMCPTRELVRQTEEELRKVGKHILGFRAVAIYGGQNMERQFSGLRKRPQIVVGTPGRIIDHLKRRTLKLEGLKLLVLDEADEMLNMGFREDMDIILKSCSVAHQTVLFSATMSKEILQISRKYQVEPVSVETSGNATNIPKIKQYAVAVKDRKKVDTLLAILGEKCYQLVLVFCNTKRKVDGLSDTLNQYGYKAEALHSDLRQRSRDNVMKRYRCGDINVLVATDVAARGIDVEGIEAVFNFDIPADSEYYVHRIGRTGRANKEGEAYSFFTVKEKYRINEFEKMTASQLIPFAPENVASIEELGTKVVEEKQEVMNIFELIKGDLEAEKQQINNELTIYNDENNSNFTMLDIAAALYRANSERVAFGAPKGKEKSSAPSKKKEVTTRFFINIGGKDNLDERGMAQFIMENTNIKDSDIAEIKILDTFSFIEIKNGFITDMIAITGAKFNRRTVTVEKAEISGGKTGGRSGGERAPRSYSKPYEDRDGGSDRPARSSKPYGERSGSSSDRPARSSKPYGERSGSNSDRPARSYSKPYGDREGSSSDRPARTYSKPYGDREGSSSDRPARSYSKPYGDREGSSSDRPARTYSKPYGDREGSSSDRPARTYSKPFGDREGGSSDRPARTYSKPFGDREGGSSDRPARSSKPYGERSGGSDKPKTYSKPFGDKKFSSKSRNK